MVAALAIMVQMPCRARKKGLADAWPSSRWRAMRSPSDLSHQQQDDDDHHDKTETTARAVAPAATVAPGRQRADQEQDQYDQQDGTERHQSLPVRRAAEADIARLRLVTKSTVDSRRRTPFAVGRQAIARSLLSYRCSRSAEAGGVRRYCMNQP